MGLGLPYTPLIPARRGFTYAPSYDRFGTGPATEFNVPEAYVAEIPNCSVIGGWGVVFPGDGRALWDVAQCEQADRFCLISTELPHVDRQRIEAGFVSVSETPIPTGILLQSWFASNFHHWLIEHLPRLSLIEQVGVPDGVPILVDSRAMDIPQLVEALAAYNPQGRQIIPLQPGVKYNVGKLYVPSCLFGTGPNLRPGLNVEIGDVTLHREAITWLRERFAPVERPGTRRIYIDRRAKMAPIRLSNGADVQAVFEEFGFETVRPGTMSFAEQRDLFGDASIIAGESGAALTNIVLAPQSTKLIVMQASRWDLNVYGDMAAYGDQECLFVVGDIIRNAFSAFMPYQAAFNMNPDSLRAILADIL
jgi:capsular polysaccharide biosynthesis protein